MARPTEAGLRRLAAEILAELTRVDRTVEECAEAAEALAAAKPPRLDVYGAAALLDTFYTGVEKNLGRIASAFDGGLPTGPAWHRRLLEEMTLDIPGVRPPVLAAAARALEPYLSFRHRFRNLYLFDLDVEPLRGLLRELPGAWQLARDEIAAFAAFIRDLLDAASD